MLVLANKGTLPTSRMCKLLGVPRSGFYHFLTSQRAREKRNDVSLRLIEKIKQIRSRFTSYGYRRVTAELNHQGFNVNHKRVLAIMRQQKLLAKPARVFKAPNAGRAIYPNLTRDFVPRTLNELWVADITFIALKREFVYLSIVLDAYSRKVVGWSLKKTIDRDLVLSALRMALFGRSFGGGLIHHSDRGAQYTSKDYVYLLKISGIAISMSRPGNPYDNAKAESFMATLKKEEVRIRAYETLAHARALIGFFIEDVYNSKRLHSALGYLSPEIFECRHKASVPLIK